MKGLISFFFLLYTIPFFSQVGIGTTNPDESSALDISSSTSGFLLPRMTTTQRNAIVRPAIGLMIFNLDTNSCEFNSGNSSMPKWNNTFISKIQSGSYEVGDTVANWGYYHVVFATPFTSVPSIQLTFREGVGVDNTGSHSVSQIKVANASTTGFTIAIYETSLTYDVFIDWVATPKTQ